ncbi:leukemia inhibitory factor receptor isoform X1 [Tachysurus vachellii]|uniref:leukemia inhibitory factor receptor isoform X1 n=1 Tax=Tachysurus vachellii TaxID=175792 RepID=UPI00296B192F|nr:leukemia inhibitory factor receptor isoform X1 [Tachysurus vachellii]
MFVLCSVTFLLLVFAETTNTLEMKSGSSEPAALSVELCVKSSWSLEVRWTEHQNSASSAQTYQVQIGQSDFNIIIQSNVRKEPGVQFVSWIWTSAMPLQCADHFIRIRRLSGSWTDWKSHYGQQNVSSKRLRLFPTQEVLQEGSSVFFCCIPSDGAQVTALQFSNTPYPLINISHRVRAIKVLRLNITKMGVKLFCQDDSGNQQAVLNYVTFPPEKPKNLSCKTSNLKNIVCSWTPGRVPNLSSVRRRRYTLHILNSDGLMFQCDERSSSCQFPVLPDLFIYNISVVVENSLGEERESYTFNITHRVYPVLEDLAVIPGSLHAEVYWTLNGNFTGLQLICQITTEPINKTTELQCVGMACVRNLSVSVQQLQPSSQYSTRGRCAVKHNSWSSWSTTHTFSTEPLVKLDVWRRMEENHHSRRIRVLWRIFSSSSHSTIDVYEVCVQQQDKSSVCVNVTETQANFTVGFGVCDVSVRAYTHTGMSLPSSIRVPALNTATDTKQKRIVGNSDGFLLTWPGLSSATCGYTLEWCLMDNLGACNLQWRKVSANQTSLLLSASEFKAGCRYTFNIYSCHSNGYQIHERHIGYLKEQKPLQAPDVCLSPSVSSHSITLMWRFNEEDPSHPGFITGYTLTIQTEPDDTHGQSFFHGVYNVTVDESHCKRVTVEGLTESKCYTLRLAACTKSGCGPESVYTVSTLPKYFTLVLKVITPLLLLIGCCCCLRSYSNTVRGIIVDVFIFPKHHNMRMMELDDDVFKVSEEISALAVEECESCDVEITEQETHSCSFLDPDSDNELMTVTNITYLLLSNTPEHEKHSGLRSEPKELRSKLRSYGQVWNNGEECHDGDVMGSNLSNGRLWQMS